MPVPFSAVALSTDSRFVALGTDETAGGVIAVQSTQTGKVLWRTKKVAKKEAVAQGLGVTEIAFTHDGALVVAGGAGWVRILDAKTGAVLAGGAGGGGFVAIAGAACVRIWALSPDGLFLAHSEMHSNSALVWHIPTRAVAHFIKLPVPLGPMVRLAFGLTVRQLFVAQAKGISTWNGETGQEMLRFEIAGAESMAVLDHANVLAVVRPATDDKAPQLDLWSAPTGRLRRSIALPAAEFGPLAASPDGGRLALPAGKVCYVWDSGKLIP